MALYTYSKGPSDVDSAIDFPFSMIKVEVVCMDAVCEVGGIFDNEKTPMSEESLRRPTPMFRYCRVVRSGTFFASFEIALGVMKSN